MTYQELLMHPEWKSKRIEILSRDKHQCLNCDNSKIEGYDNYLGTLNRRSTNPKRLIFKLTNNKETSIAIDAFRPYGLVIRNLVLFISETENIINSVAGRRLIKGESKTIQSDLLKPEWVFVNNLHVHHTYYIKSKFPWEYDNNALQTLCWECHENLHRNQTIPVYSDDKISGFLTLCKRCHGAGQFPEFCHIQAGICFRCNGARYEELIGNEYYTNC
jgi:5-methylcytosine-specific restriction endonuclease McrA